MKNLVVVESPSKIKKLESFLGKDYEVISSVGHIRDLPKSGLAVEVDNGFEPKYVESPDKKDIVQKLKKNAKTAKAIYLATDPDREGEAIAWHVGYIINDGNDLEDDKENDHLVASKIKNKDGKKPSVYRVSFNSITKEAVLDGFENPRKLDLNLIHAQQARRVLDRLVGYKLSPLLWEKIRYGLSAGRVQSVAVRFVVEREREINKFNKEPYFELIGTFKSDRYDDLVDAALRKIDGKSIYKKEKFTLFAGEYSSSKTIISTKKDSKKAQKDIKVSQFYVSKIEQKEIKSHPSPPFTTSSMQQAASSRLGLAPKRTMQLAQKLYEGGYITYMRTDSVHISPVFVKEVRKFIRNTYGNEYLFTSERFFKSKKGVKTQEAHEGIRPTNTAKLATSLPKSVSPQQKKLYDMIWRRTVASQMSPAVFENTKVLIENSKSENIPVYTFEAKGSVLKFDGYLKVYTNKRKDEFIPDFRENEKVELRKLKAIEKTMAAPPRYNESSLIKELESFGIGRPSTYAAIISTIQSRGYVKREEKVLYPTDNGIVVNDLLVDHFNQIVDIDFTAEMEEDLDEVALGNLKWRKLIGDFYWPFEKQLEKKKKQIKKEDIVNLEKTSEDCPECKQGKLIVKLGKYGKFLSCERYPDCKYARPIENGNSEPVKKEISEEISEEIKEMLKELCPNCGGKLKLKEGRFGKFISCENYPKCKYTKSIQSKINMKCPKCGEKHKGEVVMKRTKKGRTFYGCSRYPDCDFASWTRPIGK